MCGVGGDFKDVVLGYVGCRWNICLGWEEYLEIGYVECPWNI